MTVEELMKILEGFPSDATVKIDIGEGLPGYYDVNEVYLAHHDEVIVNVS